MSKDKMLSYVSDWSGRESNPRREHHEPLRKSWYFPYDKIAITNMRVFKG